MNAFDPGTPAGFCGIAATAGLAVWPLFRTRGVMLATQLAALALLSLHYALLGVTTAAIVNGLGALQLMACLAFGTHPRLRMLGYGLAGLMIALSIVTWQGLISLLSTTGNVVIAIGRLQVKADRMRLLVLAGTPFWILHDLIIASPVVLADTLCLLVGLAALLWRNGGTQRPARQF
ncbi:YgjV family protein [Dongia sedimenti]|uniref:YgjV family protein n=1 Tax=Dongia sedimenti TaxID=3064282 RepID=A0ABU0YUA0_9PROT|nr:YgjV family protein [Rhodospirillaceae bacterium R-7]